MVAVPSMNMEVSVIIPARNAAETLPQQLAALAAQDFDAPWEVVVADNGSCDGTAAAAIACADRLPDLQVVDASRRVGINHARNVAARQARGKYILSCDADDVVANSWISALKATLDLFPLAGGRLDHERLNSQHIRYWRKPSSGSGFPVALHFLPYAVTSNFGIRADVLTALGGFNEDYIRGGTDVELSWRAQLAGYKLGFAPDAVVHYRHRQRPWLAARQFYAYGAADVQLYHDFRYAGIRRNALEGVRAWGWIALHVFDPLAGSTARKGRWLCVAGHRLGRLRGSARYRTPVL